jgi:RNA polymerase sigma-70 factor (ECF subfamily)
VSRAASTSADRSAPAAHDRSTWPAVFTEHYSFVHSVTRRLAGPDLDPDDLTQDVFVTVHRRLGSLEDPARLRSWLYGICRRVVAHRRRRYKVRRAIAELLARVDPPRQDSPEAHAGRRDIERRLYAALDRLSAKRRETLILFALEEMDGKQIAELLDIPVNTVWTRLHAARKDLAMHLKEAGFDGGKTALAEALWHR